jgi:MOSC domain-containing protein YiiM
VCTVNVLRVRGTVLQINISAGGIPKTAVARAEVGSLGITGDQHNDKKHHGGTRKALLLIPAEVVDALCGEGWPLSYGALGENLTTSGLDPRAWRTGQMYRAGAVLIQLTEPRGPCLTLNPYGPGIQERIFDKRVKALDPASPKWGLSGFYASVLEPGIIQVKDIIEAID